MCYVLSCAVYFLVVFMIDKFQSSPMADSGMTKIAPGNTSTTTIGNTVSGNTASVNTASSDQKMTHTTVTSDQRETSEQSHPKGVPARYVSVSEHMRTHDIHESNSLVKSSTRDYDRIT